MLLIGFQFLTITTYILSVYFVIKSKLSNKIKVIIFSILSLLYISTGYIVFNFAKDTQLNNIRLENQKEFFEEKRNMRIKIIPDIVKIQDNETTNYIENEANNTHRRILEGNY